MARFGGLLSVKVTHFTLAKAMTGILVACWRGSDDAAGGSTRCVVGTGSLCLGTAATNSAGVRSPRELCGRRSLYIASPSFKLLFCISQAEENLSVQKFISQPTVEAFDVAVLHRQVAELAAQSQVSDVGNPLSIRTTRTRPTREIRPVGPAVAAIGGGDETLLANRPVDCLRAAAAARACGSPDGLHDAVARRYDDTHSCVAPARVAAVVLVAAMLPAASRLVLAAFVLQEDSSALSPMH